MLHSSIIWVLNQSNTDTQSTNLLLAEITARRQCHINSHLSILNIRENHFLLALGLENRANHLWQFYATNNLYYLHTPYHTYQLVSIFSFLHPSTNSSLFWRELSRRELFASSWMSIVPSKSQCILLEYKAYSHKVPDLVVVFRGIKCQICWTVRTRI